jgi:hypothetical protein
MKKRILFTILCLSLLTNCEKNSIDSSECIEERVRKFARSSACETSSVALYTFKGENAYVFSDGNCGADMGASVYKENCEYLGFLGGFTGNMIIDGEKFYEVSQFVKIIWEN